MNEALSTYMKYMKFNKRLSNEELDKIKNDIISQSNMFLYAFKDVLENQYNILKNNYRPFEKMIEDKKEIEDKLRRRIVFKRKGLEQELESINSLLETKKEYIENIMSSLMNIIEIGEILNIVYTQRDIDSFF